MRSAIIHTNWIVAEFMKLTKRMSTKYSKFCNICNFVIKILQYMGILIWVGLARLT
jgi:hypothetical protein